MDGIKAREYSPILGRFLADIKNKEMDPEKYDEDLAKLELKAKRAAERKSEAVQHEKNLRRGIKRPKKQEVPDEKGPDRRRLR